MQPWLAWLLAAAIALIAAWAAVSALRSAQRKERGRQKPGGLQMLGAMMLGFGEPLDPPSRHVAEAKSENLEDDESGDPPVT